MSSRASASTGAGHDPGCACPACQGLTSLVRPRFFAGQILTETDLMELERYAIATHRMHNRYLHGWGVVCGLDVACEDCRDGIVVRPGYALDPCGRDLVVPGPQHVDAAKLVRECLDAERAKPVCDPPTVGPPKGCDVDEHWCVTLRYREVPVRPVTPLASSGQSSSPCSCGCHAGNGNGNGNGNGTGGTGSNGSGTGSGPVGFQGGYFRSTLGGTGTIAGAVAVPGDTFIHGFYFLSPGAGVRRPGGGGGTGTLTIQSTLTFDGFSGNGNVIFHFELNSRTARADKVVANGVSISGAQISFGGLGGKQFTSGTVFTVIDNTAATPIAGTFENLPDGFIFSANRNNFQASYEGGDGNDLTLTVVP